MEQPSPEEIREMQELMDSITPNKLPEDKFRHIKSQATKGQLAILSDLVKARAGESELHRFIETNEVVLSFALYAHRTGHHGIYVFSKQQVIPKIQGVQSGLIPDFIVGGSDSGGVHWWIIELKGADENIFNEDKKGAIAFSNTANKAVFQLLEYIAYTTEIQSTLRAEFRMTNFREPNGLIIMGNEAEFKASARKRKAKAAWNNLHPKKLEIRTYDWLLRNFTANEGMFGHETNQ
jgi:hypothetical protein